MGVARGWCLGVTSDPSRRSFPPPASYLAMVLLPRQCLLVGFLLTAVHPEPLNVCRENQYLVNTQCCTLCLPGEKLVQDCTDTTPTLCHPCGRGEFLDTPNNEKYCHPHKYCDPNLGLQVRMEGTTKTDTICVCNEGQHCVNDHCDSCAPHSSCPPGDGVKQMATEVSDTVCEPCPVGFFSSVSSASEKCHPWTSCEVKGLVERRAGTNKTDVFCDSQDRMRALVAVPVVMAVLLTALLVYACISESPEKVAEQANYKGKRQDPVEIDMDDFPGPLPNHPVQETLHGCQPVTQEDGKESRISVQERL
ncbi:tumor necrosis factor receptor superfamily member 5 isoform X3 [Desmodus rotundus]|uniref:tumor necrosis factor receptor superfamily member 5 isoform X3 n=1 Tax=Desmodus rotundus TaxID=9430 RepID=UPI002380F165|nr:tumor necrosis factor receptor superfamily member 5 isoform X3 [Desmodus rotundus]